MRLPEKSDLLITGVNTSSLILGVLCAKLGLTVVMVDERTNVAKPELKFEPDAFQTNFLKWLGFDIPDTMASLTYDELYRKGFLLLAKHLGSVFWESKSIKTNTNEILISNSTDTIKHTYAFQISAAEVGISANHNLNLTCITLLGWRIVWLLRHKINSFKLQTYRQEVDLLKNQYLVKQSTGLLNRIRSKFANHHIELPHLVDGPISLHLSQANNVKAGERIGDFPLYDEKLKKQVTLYSWLKFDAISVLLFGNLLPANLISIAKWLQLNFDVQLFYIPYTERNNEIFARWNILKEERKTLIIRPDFFIGLVHDAVDIDVIDNYLTSFIGLRNKT